MNRFYFLRHGDVTVDPSKPASEWTLSEKGRNSVIRLMERRVFDNIDFVYSSEEDKAYSTARIVGDALKKKVWRLPDFNELDRSKSGFLENYYYALQRAFSNLHQSVEDWETCGHALTRFRQGVDTLNQTHEDKALLIVSHGVVLTLYFAFLKGEMTHLFFRWKKLGFPSYGIVEGSTVVKDIIE